MNIEEFGKLNLTRLDGKISADKRLTWESIYASYRSESLLTGKTVGVDSVKLSGNKNTHCLTVIDNTIKILIPFSEVWYDKEDCPPDYVIRTISGAEIDYVITGIDRLGNCCIASRRKALKIRRRSFMKKEFIPGKRTECDIIAVGRSKVMCCCHGFDLMLRTSDISYGMIPDLREYIHTGEKHEAIMKSLDRVNEELKISIKEAKPHPFDGAEMRHPLNCRRVSEITGKYGGGVFCRIEDNLDCLCTYLPDQNALDFHIGDKVIIVIRKYNYDKKLIYGRILSRW